MQDSHIAPGVGSALLSLLQLAAVFLGGLFLGSLRHRERNLPAFMLAHRLLDTLLIWRAGGACAVAVGLAVAVALPWMA